MTAGSSRMTERARHLQLVSESSETPDPWVGRTLDGRYRILRVLGAGGMGMVYEARHTVLDRRLAIKVLRADVSRNDAVITRFEREARAASAIGSRHICDVSDFGVLPDGSAYLVMELLDGPSLRDSLDDASPMAPARVLSIGAQLCEALGAAHHAGIVHRDLKPDNVHLVKDERTTDFVKVLDFGIAKVGSAADKALTQAGEVFGTPRYMSPEQCAGTAVDHRTDIYALGIMLYEMACGQVPFDADNLMGLLTKQVYERPLPPRELAPPVDVGPGLEAIIMRCLEKSPAARYASMADLRADLDAVAEGRTPVALIGAMDRSVHPEVAPSSSGILPSRHAHPVPAPAPARRLAVPVALGVLVLGAALAFGVAFAAWPGTAPRVTSVDDSTRSETTDDSTVSDSIVSDSTVDDVTPNDATGDDSVRVSDETEAVSDAREDGASAAGVVRLTSDPDGAEVYGSNDAFIGNTPIDLPRPTEGTVTYRVVRAGYAERAVVISQSSQEALSLTLSRARVGHPPVRPRVQPQVGLVTPPASNQTETRTPPETPHNDDWSLPPAQSDGLINPFGARRRAPTP